MIVDVVMNIPKENININIILTLTAIMCLDILKTISAKHVTHMCTIAMFVEKV